MQSYSHCICRVILFPFYKILQALEDDCRWYGSTIPTNCHYNSNVFLISCLLLMLNTLSSSSDHLFVGGSSTCLEGGLITPIDVFFGYWRSVVSCFENVSQEVIEVMMGEWIDCLPTKWLKWMCSVGFNEVLVASQEAVNPTPANTTLRKLCSKPCPTYCIDVLPCPLLAEWPTSWCEFKNKVDHNLLLFWLQPCLLLVGLSDGASTSIGIKYSVAPYKLLNIPFTLPRTVL